jgi:hypothetical protein
MNPDRINYQQIPATRNAMADEHLCEYLRELEDETHNKNMMYRDNNELLVFLLKNSIFTQNYLCFP